MKHRTSRIVRAFRYAKRYWRNTMREVRALHVFYKELTKIERSDRIAAKPAQIKRQPTQTLTIRVKGYVRADGTRVKGFTRKVTRNGSRSARKR